MEYEKIEAIKVQINEYENHIDAYWSSLNTEGVWLFLATLGCWSVGHAESQLFAIIIAVILFSHRIVVKMSDRRSFPTIYKEIKRSIIDELDEGDTKDARLYALDKIKNKKLSLKNTLKSTAVFLLCYSFLVVTFLHWWSLHG